MISQAALLGQPDPSYTASLAAAAAEWDPTAWQMPALGRSLFYAATGALAGCATGLLGIGACAARPLIERQQSLHGLTNLSCVQPSNRRLLKTLLDNHYQM